MRILFDLSALLAAAARFAPVGILRVELAYAKHLLTAVPERLAFTATDGRLGMLDRHRAIALIETLDALWSGETVDQAAHRRAIRLARRLRLDLWMRGERAIYDWAGRRGAGGEITLLIVSHRTLERPAALGRVKQRTGARVVCLVHDLIGIEWPGAVPPKYHRTSQRCLASVALADRIVANSAGTAASLLRHFSARGLHAAPIVVAPLGVDVDPNSRASDGDSASQPYFVYVASIEPRKNHRLLFSVWERLAAERGRRAPRLVLIGRRAWNGDRILSAVARSEALRGLIEEHNGLPNGAMVRLVAGAKALLFPSFAEGFGLPVAEALALGVPVICSDLAELREVGGEVPDYLDPFDEAAWVEAIGSYASIGSPRRQAQLARLKEWQAPTWKAHFERIEPLFAPRPAGFATPSN